MLILLLDEDYIDLTDISFDAYIEYCPAQYSARSDQSRLPSFIRIDQATSARRLAWTLLSAQVPPRVCFFGHHHNRVDADISGVRCIELNKIAPPGRVARSLGALNVKLSREDVAAIEQSVPRDAAASAPYPQAQLAHMDSERPAGR